MTTVDRDLVVSLLGDRTKVEVAKIVGCSVRTVLRIQASLPDYSPTRTYHAPLSPEILEKAKVMLEDRAGYRQAALTLGVGEKSLARRLPGYALTRAESRERAAWGRTFNNLGRVKTSFR